MHQQQLLKYKWLFCIEPASSETLVVIGEDGKPIESAAPVQLGEDGKPIISTAEEDKTVPEPEVIETNFAQNDPIHACITKVNDHFCLLIFGII